jgi:hypothetical protein
MSRAVTHSAVIKFAPIWTFERHNDPVWNRAGRTLYEAGSLKFLPSVTEVPLIVDHDEEREIGVVHELSRIEWSDGPWICARASIYDAPAWLQQYKTKASFSHRNLSTRTYTECELVARALVDEVSVLSPSVKPVEPLAEVLLLERAAPPAARAAAAYGEYRLKPGESWIPSTGVLVRKNIGRVTGYDLGNGGGWLEFER